MSICSSRWRLPPADVSIRVRASSSTRVIDPCAPVWSCGRCYWPLHSAQSAELILRKWKGVLEVFAFEGRRGRRQRFRRSRFVADAGLFTHAVNQNAEHFGHLDQRATRPAWERRYGSAYTKPASLCIENQDAVFKGIQFQTGGVLQQVREDLVIALQGFVEADQVRRSP